MRTKHDKNYVFGLCYTPVAVHTTYCLSESHRVYAVLVRLIYTSWEFQKTSDRRRITISLCLIIG